jgi:hypothetical protein
LKREPADFETGAHEGLKACGGCDDFANQPRTGLGTRYYGAFCGGTLIFIARLGRRQDKTVGWVNGGASSVSIDTNWREV